MNTNRFYEVLYELDGYKDIEEFPDARGRPPVPITEMAVSAAVKKIEQAMDFFGDHLIDVEPCPKDDGYVDLALKFKSTATSLPYSMFIEISPEGCTTIEQIIED